MDFNSCTLAIPLNQSIIGLKRINHLMLFYSIWAQAVDGCPMLCLWEVKHAVRNRSNWTLVKFDKLIVTRSLVIVFPVCLVGHT